MKRKIILSSQYKKDIKLARRRNLPEEELNDIVLKLANDVSLSAKNKDHALRMQGVPYQTRLVIDIQKDRQQRITDT